MTESMILIELLLTALVVLLGLRIYAGWQGRQEPSAACSLTIGSREIQGDAAGFVQQAGTMLVLADGLGSSYGGRIASRLAVEVFCDLFRTTDAFEKPQYFFRRAFAAANRRILELLDDQRGGAAVASALVRDQVLYYALAGNVQLAVWRDGDLIPVSEGHTIGRLAAQRWQEGRISREDAIQVLREKRLYNYVGQDGFHDIEYFSEPLPLRAGDIVVLLTDGVTSCLRWRDIEAVLATGAAASELAFQVIEQINRSPATDKDNAGIVLLKV